MARLRGIDVSHWQEPGAAIIRRSGAVFAWVKTSQGASLRDARAAAHHRVLGQLGWARGPYHYCDTRWSAEANARNLVTAMGGLHWELRPVLDCEANRGGLDRDALAAWILRCAQEVERLCGVRPMIYTYASWWNSSVRALAAFLAYVLWVARYPNAYAGGAVPNDQTWTGPAQPWPRATVWQYATTGNLDRNLVAEADFAAIHSGTAPPPTTPGRFPMDDAEARHEFATLHQQLQTLLDTTAKKAVALRSKKDSKVWIVSDEGRWHVPDMETLNVLVFVGQVHGFGTDGVPVVEEAQLDGIPVLAAPK